MRGVNERSLRYLVLHRATDLADRQQHTEIRTKVQYSNCSIQLDPCTNVIPITGLPNVHTQHDRLPQSLGRNTGVKASSSLLLSSEVFYFSWLCRFYNYSWTELHIYFPCFAGLSSWERDCSLLIISRKAVYMT